MICVELSSFSDIIKITNGSLFKHRSSKLNLTKTMAKPLFVFNPHGNINNPETVVSTSIKELNSNDIDFVKPSKRKTISNSTNIQPKKYVLDVNKLYDNNRYQPLSDHNYSCSTNNDTNMDDETASAELPKNLRPPPIFVHDVNNHQVITKDIKNLISNEFFTEVKGTSLKINLSTIDEFRKLTKFYDESNVKYHTFQNKEDRKLEIVIKNVPCSLTPEEIKDELISQNYPVLTVARLFNKEKVPYPVCAVSLENNESGMEIFQLNRLCYTVVHVEQKRKSPTVPQCTRCQRYGHTRNFCKLDPRCVRCTGQHLYSACPKNKTDPPECVNCGENHTANFKGCKYYQDLKSRNKNHKPRPTDHLSLDNNEHSGPSATRPTEPSQHVPSNPNSGQKSYAQATSKTTTRHQTNKSDSTVSNDVNQVNEANLSGSNIEKLILDLVKLSMPIIKQIISNVISSFFQNAI